MAKILQFPTRHRNGYSLSDMIGSARTMLASALTATRRWRMKQDLEWYISNLANPKNAKQLVGKLESMGYQHYMAFLSGVYSSYRQLGWARPYPALAELYLQRGTAYLREHPEALRD
ncbi:hypothetical protein HYV80_03560 [Candidatus Woesearchaeota archaeon]|nr:hypothetical protein [Candidatus Woesearchaeota archaeon]